MTEWKPFEEDGVGIHAVVEGVPLYVVPSRMWGWSWHCNFKDKPFVQGYEPTMPAACARAEQAARSIE